MRDYGTIKTAFWSHYKTASLSLPAQSVLLYLIAGPHSNGTGVYRLPLAYMVADFELPIQRMLDSHAEAGYYSTPESVIREAMEELQAAKMVYYCPETHYALIRDFLEWNPIENTRVWVCRLKEIEAVPKRFQYPQQLLHTLSYLENRPETWKKDTVDRFVAPQTPRLKALRKRLANGKDRVSIPWSPQPNPTEPNPTQPNPTHRDKGSTSEPQSGAVLWWPLKGGGVYPVTEEKITEWEAAFQNIDVRGKLKRLYQWNVDNPRRQKTKAGVLRHISGALQADDKEAEQNHGNRSTKPSTETGRNREAIERARANGGF